MHRANASLAALVFLCAGQLHAADTQVRVIISSDVRPGVYGRVEIGNAPPPPVVYAEPRVIVREPGPAAVQPVYLHVPPGHARNWKKHCHKYNACAQPVYFVESEEYKPKKKKPK
jgi:hypothetical protein